MVDGADRRGLGPVREWVRRGPPPAARFPERRLLADYLAVKFPRSIVLTSQPVGPAPTLEAGSGPSLAQLRAARPWRPEVDAIVVMADAGLVRMGSNGRAGWLMEVPADAVLLLIEAKVKALLDGLAKLPLYRQLVGSSPELAAAAGREVRMRLVTPTAAPWLEGLATAVGAEVDYYRPVWVEEYYTYRQGYWSRAARMQREEVLRARRRLGVA